MARNGQHREAASRDVNPDHIVSVKDFSSDTLRNVIAHLKASTSFEHLVYREAELDAIWTITGFFLANEPASDRKSTRLNSSHSSISYAVFCLKKKKAHEYLVTL